MEKTEKENTVNEKKSRSYSGNLLVVIRISGMVKVRKDIAECLDRLRLRRKYACVLINGNDRNIMGMLKKVRFYIAYGEIDKDVLVELLKEKGKLIEGNKKELKIDAEKTASELINGKKLSELGLKPFFRLHPPRKGIKSKLQYPKGVLGNNKKDINKLIGRML